MLDGSQDFGLEDGMPVCSPTQEDHYTALHVHNRFWLLLMLFRSAQQTLEEPSHICNSQSTHNSLPAQKVVLTRHSQSVPP